MFVMKLQQCKFFLNFLFAKSTPKEQIRFILRNPASIHLQCFIEIIFNLLENNFIKIPLPVKRKIKQHKKVLFRFVSLKGKNNFSYSRKILRKYYKLIFFILYKSKNIILQAITQ